MDTTNDTNSGTSTATSRGDGDGTAVVDAYLQTWNETDPQRRAALIETALAETLWYRDPMLEADGREAYDKMIAGVQDQFAGLVMRRTSGVDAHHDVVRFDWALGVPDAEPAFSGVDVAKFDDEGKLHYIVGFVPNTAPVAEVPVSYVPTP